MDILNQDVFYILFKYLSIRDLLSFGATSNDNCFYVSYFLNNIIKSQLSIRPEKNKIIFRFYHRYRIELCKYSNQEWLFSDEYDNIFNLYRDFINFYFYGQKKHEVWYNARKYHSKNGPSYIKWFNDGKKNHEGWYNDGFLHRYDGPSKIEWYSTGDKYLDEWYESGCQDWSKNKKYGMHKEIYYSSGEKKYDVWYLGEYIHLLTYL